VGAAGAVPGAVPVAALPLGPGGVAVPGLVVWATATPALVASISPAIASFMKGLLAVLVGANEAMSKTFRFCARFQLAIWDPTNTHGTIGVMWVMFRTH
jgi:hypothetical protein